MSKQFWGILVAIAIIFFGVVIINNHKDNGTSKAKGTPTSHVEGTSAKNITLVEYGDYQCPGCGAFYQSIKDTAKKYEKTVKFQFRNLPLTSLHPNAFAAARAAEAAALQNKFWEMHDKLYEENGAYYAAQQQGSTYNTWVNASDPLTLFISYATALGLDTTKFKADFASTKVNNLINADVAAFDATKAAKATPTFFLNGKQVANEKFTDSNGQPSIEAFSKVLDAALKAAK